MLRWALTFLIVGLVFAVLGFGNLAGAFVGVAKLLFFLAVGTFLVLSIVAYMMDKSARERLH